MPRYERDFITNVVLRADFVPGTAPFAGPFPAGILTALEDYPERNSVNRSRTEVRVQKGLQGPVRDTRTINFVEHNFWTEGRTVHAAVCSEYVFVSQQRYEGYEPLRDRFLDLLEAEFDEPETAAKLWESFFIRHLDQLDMTIRKYPPGHIYEFDSLDDLRAFDESYVADARSPILAETAARLGCAQGDIRSIRALTGGTAEAEGFAFTAPDGQYKYIYKTKRIERI